MIIKFWAPESKRSKFSVSMIDDSAVGDIAAEPPNLVW